MGSKRASKQSLDFQTVFSDVEATLMGIVAIFLFAILGAFVGAITGFIIENIPTLGPLVRQGFLLIFNITNPKLTAIGAMLGFVAGFFKSNLHAHEQFYIKTKR